MVQEHVLLAHGVEDVSLMVPDPLRHARHEGLPDQVRPVAGNQPGEV